MKYFLIPEDLLQSIRNYLLEKPAREVMSGIIRLDSLTAYEESEKLENPNMENPYDTEEE